MREAFGGFRPISVFRSAGAGVVRQGQALELDLDQPAHRKAAPATSRSSPGDAGAGTLGQHHAGRLRPDHLRVLRPAQRPELRAGCTSVVTPSAPAGKRRAVLLRGRSGERAVRVMSTVCAPASRRAAQRVAKQKQLSPPVALERVLACSRAEGARRSRSARRASSVQAADAVVVADPGRAFAASGSKLPQVLSPHRHARGRRTSSRSACRMSWACRRGR